MPDLSFDGTNLRVPGRVICQGVDASTAYIDDADIKTDAGAGAEKMEHQHQPNYGQPNTTATTETRPLHLARGAGEVVAFQAGSIAPCAGGATITVDLKKNGTTVLTGVITLNNANTARVAVSGTLVATPTYAAGDLLEVVITATVGGGTLGTGFFCQAVLREAAAP